MFRPCEYADEPPKHQLEAPLRLLWRELRNGGLFSDDELQFWDEVDDELTVRAQRLAQGIPPLAKLRLSLAQKRADKALEGLDKGGVRDVALVLVELAGREEATRRYEHPVQLVHYRGLADAGKGSEQSLDLALPAVQPFRDHEPVRRVLC